MFWILFIFLEYGTTWYPMDEVKRKKIDYDVMWCRFGWEKRVEENSENINDFSLNMRRIWSSRKSRKSDEDDKNVSNISRLLRLDLPRNEKHLLREIFGKCKNILNTKLLNYFSRCRLPTLKTKYRRRFILMLEIKY